MFKVCLVLGLAAVAAVAAQEQPEGAPEPYSYGYSTDTHSAQEQRDPSGRVTGSYQLVGDDGRERRVEYVADASGFRAKVVTNEVGTKSESPADVELVANEPTPAQYAAQQTAQYAVQQTAQYAQSPPQQVHYGYAHQQVQQGPQIQVQRAQAVGGVQQSAGYRQVSSSSSYSKQAAPQQAGYGYGSGYGYGNGYGYGPQPGYGYSSGYYNYPVGYGSGYSNLGYGYAAGAPGAVYSSQRSVNVGNYNNHLPSQYYKSVGVSGPPAGVGGYSAVAGQSYRYVSQPAGVAATSYSSQPIVGNSSPPGSSNYLVLQKRATSEENEAKRS